MSTTWGQGPFAFAGYHDRAYVEVLLGVIDAFLAVAAVGGDGSWRAPGSLLDPRDRRRQLRRVSRVARLDGVIDDDAVVMSMTWALWPNSTGLPRRPLAIGRASPRSMTARTSPATPPASRRVMLTANAQLGGLDVARRTARWTLTSSRSASRAAVSAYPASSPALLSTAAVASSRPTAARERSFDATACALAAALDRSRNRVRTAPPAAWLRLPVAAIRRPFASSDSLGPSTATEAHRVVSSSASSDAAPAHPAGFG